MKLKTLISHLSPAERERMARLARTSVGHLRWQLAGGHARPSFAMALRLVRASRKLNPKHPDMWLSLAEWFSEDAAA